LDPVVYRFVINPESIVFVTNNLVIYVVYFFLAQTNGSGGGGGVSIGNSLKKHSDGFSPNPKISRDFKALVYST
jgi:hypothetical protein